MEQTEMRKEIFQQLKNFYGSLNEVASRAGMTREYVGKVLAQKPGFENDRVWEAAAEVLLEKKKAKKASQEKVSMLHMAASSILI